MELITLQGLKADPATLIKKIQAQKKKDDDGAKNYEPENHDVVDPQKRKKREVKVDTGVKDELGNPIMRTEYEEVSRITSSAQKLIVNWAVQIAAGVPVEVTAEPKDATEEKMLAMLKKTLTDNKMEYLDQEILRLTSVYKRCAEIWYEEEAEDGYWGELGNSNSKLRMRLTILSEEAGDELYPIRDNKGNMIALGREYLVWDDETEKEISKFDLFATDSITTYAKSGDSWIQELDVPLKYGKANFIYHEQKKREWEDVQSRIDRLEKLDSNHADQNDATGSPMIAVTGEVSGFSKRGETGKVFELENGGDIKVVESSGAPESIKMERQNLVDGIFDETQTPQVSFSKAAGFGQLPGITLKLMFLPATLKALSKQSGWWGMGIQRRCNFLKYAMAFINVDVKPALNMDIRPKFGIYMPENETEKYDNAVKLVEAGLISKETTIAMLGLVDNAADEIKKIELESKSQAKGPGLGK